MDAPIAVQEQLITTIGIGVATAQFASPVQRPGHARGRAPADIAVTEHQIAAGRRIGRRKMHGAFQQFILAYHSRRREQQQTKQPYFERHVRHQAHTLRGECRYISFQALNTQGGHDPVQPVKQFLKRYYDETLSGR